MLSTLFRVFIAFLILVAADALISSGDGSPARADSFETSNQETWVRALEENANRMLAAEGKVAALQRRVSEARRRHYPRGEALGALERELEDAREELEAARGERPRLLEDARRAGVSAGALRPFEPPPAAPRAR